MTATAPAAVLLPTVEPGSEEWLRRMSASKIAAVLGLSTYESRFSLWHRMAGLTEPEPDDDLKRRGHYLEPAIAAWFADQHPDWQVDTTGTWVHPERDWTAASPDRLITTETGEVRLLECKSAAEPSEWGEPGTDQIPAGYRAQVQWQMDVLGVRVCHVAVLTAYLSFAEYVVTYDPDDATFMRTRAAEFMASLPGGKAPRRPDIDGHSATYQAVRELHPDIDGGDYDVPAPLAERYCAARHALKAAETNEREARAELADAMGTAKRAVFDGDVIATRAAKQGGTPYLTAAKRLPDLTQPKAA